ncbi:MAG: alpha/beta hydrolase [Burkholderiaceae bacterium]|nr:alpha/beta hydrolase [Burkholderiaceae bacterium]
MAPRAISPLRTADLGERLSRLARDFPCASADIGDGQVSYRTCGSGPVLVLLHGIGSGAASWMDCALTLAAQHRVVAWDAPGYGASTRLPQESPLASDYAERLWRLLAALNVKSCVLVGHSLGALMAAAYAVRYGATVEKLVLLSPAQGYGSEAKKAEGAKVVRDRLAVLAELGIDGMAAKRAERLVSERAGEAARAWVRWNMEQLHAQGYTQAVRLLCGDAIEKYRPPVPASIYCGDADPVTTPAASKVLAEQWGVPYGMIESSGHACHVERPEAVAALLIREMEAR